MTNGTKCHECGASCTGEHTAHDELTASEVPVCAQCADMLTLADYWTAEARRILALPMPQTPAETDLRMRQLMIVADKLANGSE
jgi:hypothetical protein